MIWVQKQTTTKINKEVVIMCMTKKELESKVEELRSLKTMKEEIENELRAVEHAEYSETENLYNCVGNISENSPESEMLEMEQLTEFLNGLSYIQRKIAQMKLDGYSNKEIYLSLEIRRSTYYVEMQRIKKTLEKMIG